ncbi:MAG: hypothetical protein O3A21_09850 [Proteobacteria bacterium]|nr:hypothetical protein [Pseudomonadota bacterium]
MSAADEIDDEELEKLIQFAKAQGKELSTWLARWRDAELAGYPAEAILTACLTASLVPVADILLQRERHGPDGDGVGDVSSALRCMLHGRLLATGR